MAMETKQQARRWWNQLFHSRNLVLSGLGVAALTAVLAASSDGFGQPEAKTETAAAAPSSSAGLRGMLPEELPDALLADAFDPLGKNWEKWSEQVGENLAKLYGEEPVDAAGQRKALASLKSQLQTLKAAASRAENRGIQDTMVGLHGRLTRRVDLFVAALDTLDADPNTSRAAKIKAAGAGVLAALKNLRADLRTNDGLAWMGYVKSAELTKAVNSGDASNGVFAAVKKRLAGRGKLSKTQSEFLDRPVFTTLEAALGEEITASSSPVKKVNVAALRASLKSMIAAIEKYEATNSVTATRIARAAYEKIRAEAADDGAALSDAMRSHYVNYNFRVYISETFMNRTIGESRTERRPVSDNILGAAVSGNSTTNARVTVDFVPSSGKATMDIVLTGRTRSSTVGVTSQATIWTSGNHTFVAKQRVVFDGDRLTKVGRVRISVNANNTTTGVSTKMGNFPFLGGIAKSIARQKVNEKRGQSESIAEQKIRDQVLPEFRKEVNETLAKANKDLEKKVIAQLKESNLMPEARAVRSTDDYLLLSGRIMTSGELSGSTTNPTEPPGTGLTVRFHESVMNNAVDRINLAGRKMTSEQIREEIRNSISDFLGDNYDPDLENSGAKPMGKKTPSTDKFVFDPHDPIRLRVRNGQLNVVIRCGLERQGEKPIPMQVITVPLKFGVTKDNVTITRGIVLVAPAAPTKDRAEQIVRAGVMRTKIESAIPNESRKRKLTFEREGKKPVSVNLTKIKTVNGWFTVWVN